MSIFSDIKICIFDVDGTLTPGTYQVSDKGDFSKTFHTRDFDGLSQLLKNDIRVVIISTSHDDVILKQIERIKKQSSMSQLWTKWIEEEKLIVINKSGNKADRLNPILNSFNLLWKNVAYMGDAEGDIECLELAGLPACPSDAISEVKDMGFYPSDFPGGHGAVYDFCKYILKNKEEEK